MTHQPLVVATLGSVAPYPMSTVLGFLGQRPLAPSNLRGGVSYIVNNRLPQPAAPL